MVMVSTKGGGMPFDNKEVKIAGFTVRWKLNQRGEYNPRLFSWVPMPVLHPCSHRHPSTRINTGRTIPKAF